MGHSLKEVDDTQPIKVLRADGTVVEVRRKGACFLSRFKIDSEKPSIKHKAVVTGIAKRWKPSKEVPLMHKVVLITEKPFVTPCTLKRNEIVKNTKNVKAQEKTSSHCNEGAFIDYTQSDWLLQAFVKQNEQ